MNELTVLIAIVITTYIGYLFIKGFELLNRENFFEILAYSFGLGVGLIALQMFCYSRLGINWSVFSLLIPYLILNIILLVLKKKIYDFKLNLNINFNKVDKIILVFIFLLSGFVVFESLIRPLTAWDGWASWLLKAKIFYMDGLVNANIFNYIQSEYPLIVSLYSTFIYTFTNGINDRTVLLIYPYFYLSLSLIFFFSIKEKLGVTKSLIFTFLLMSTQNLIRHAGRYEAGQADLILSYYIFSSCILFFKYLKSKNYKVLILLSSFLAISALIKNEGLPFSITLGIITVYFIIKVKMYKHLAIILFWLIPVFDWQFYKSTNHLPINYVFNGTFINFSRTWSVLLEISKQFINFQNWNFLWLVFWLSFIYSLFKKSSSIIICSYIIIISQLVVYFIIFLMTPVDPIMHIDNTIDRLFIHLAPLAVLSIALTMNQFLPDLSKLKYEEK